MLRFCTAALMLVCAGVASAQTTLPDPMTLEDATRITLENSPSIQAAAERVAQARARVRQAAAGYLPTVSGNMTLSESTLSENDYKAAREAAFWGPFAGLQSQLQRAPLTGSWPTYDSLLEQGSQAAVQGAIARGQVDDRSEANIARIEATWMLFDGFAREFRVKAAQYGRRESQAAFDDIRRLLLNSVAIAFYNAQQAREEIAIAGADEEFNRRQLKEAKARRRVGTGSLSDQLNFEVQVNAAISDSIEAQRQYQVSLVGLAALLGLPIDTEPGTINLVPLQGETEREMAEPTVDPLLDTALEARPDLVRTTYGIERAGAVVGQRRASFFPSVSANASYSARRDDDMRFGEDDFDATVGLNLSYTFFAGGRRVAELSEARRARTEAQRLQTEAQLAVVSEVRESVRNVIAAQQSVRLQRTNTDLVQRARDLVEKEYQGGQASLSRLNQAQRDLIRAQVNLARARLSLRRAWYQLRTATAETLPSE